MKWKTRKVILIFLFFMYFTAIILIPSNVATDTDYNAPYQPGAGPTIDGTITSAEWFNITPYELTFQYNVMGNSTIKADLYLLHNGATLFIGLNITMGDNQSDDTDAFYIYLDESHDEKLKGEWNNSKEEGIELMRDGNFTDLSYNGTEWIDDETISLTKGPCYGATNGAGQWEFKFISSYDAITRTKLNTSDFDENLPSNVLENALEIGFNIEYYDADINLTDSCTTTDNGTRSLNPEDWDNLVFGEVPDPPPNLEAIWVYIIIAMIIPAGVIVTLFIVLYRKKTD